MILCQEQMGRNNLKTILNMQRNNQRKMTMKSYLPTVSKMCIIILVIGTDRRKIYFF